MIKGTQVYDSTKGAFVDLSILDVLQVRPFVSVRRGTANGRSSVEQVDPDTRPVVLVISVPPRISWITTSNRSCLNTLSSPSEPYHLCASSAKLTSRFIPGMVDALNAEIALGTITSVQDAIQWLGYTYLFVRMRREPFIYGTST